MKQVLMYLQSIKVADIRYKFYIFANILIVIYGFVLFIDYKASRAIAMVLLLIWLVTGEYKKKFKKIFSNQVTISFLIFIGLFILGLFWTEDLYAGRKILERPLLYLIVPLIVSMYQKAFLKYYVLAMILAILYTSLVTLFIDQGLLNIPYNSDESPYVNRVYLAGMLIFIYTYLLSKIQIKNSVKLNLFLGVTIILIVYALIVSGSRMGHINLIIATSIVLLYRYKFQKIHIFSIGAFLIVLSFSLYGFSSKIKSEIERTTNVLVNMNLKAQILDHEVSNRTSLTCRFEFWYYAYEIGKKFFPLGVGTGDGVLELERYIGKKETDSLFKSCLGDGTGQFNPHNMYLFMFMQFGLLGILILLWMLYIHLREALKSESVAFVVLVITTMITLLALSELFTSKFFIPFYGYAIIVMYLISQESKEDKTLIPWK